MKRILLIIATLSVFLLGLGTAHAVIGVVDDVPGQDIVIPLFCEFAGNADADIPDVGFGLNTLFAVGDVKGENILEDIIGPLGGLISFNNIVTLDAHVIVNNFRSEEVRNFTQPFTFLDIVPGNACDLFKDAAANARATAAVTIKGKKYFVGYAVMHFTNLSVTGGNQPGDQFFGLEDVPMPLIAVLGDVLNRFVGWTYLTDLNKGFASGFNALSFEFGTDLNSDGTTNLNEGGFGELLPVVAQIFNLINDPNVGVVLNDVQWQGLPLFATRLYPRFFLLNDSVDFPDTFNWWFFLFGTNNSSRQLFGVQCNEEEVCDSITIPVPNELNAINVKDVVPNRIVNRDADGKLITTGGMGIFKIRTSRGTLIAPDEAILSDYLNDNNAVLCDFATKYLAQDFLRPQRDPASPQVRIEDFFNPDGRFLGVNYGADCVTVAGWSYQRAQGSTVSASWDVIHPVHRNQCKGFDTFGCNLFGVSAAIQGLNFCGDVAFQGSNSDFPDCRNDSSRANFLWFFPDRFDDQDANFRVINNPEP